jgi:hypothetical protein
MMLQSLRDEGLMKEDNNGDPMKMGKLTAFCDNCTGQNKNNTVIRMAAYSWSRVVTLLNCLLFS